jgi:ribosome-interacting GTPase 1
MPANLPPEYFEAEKRYRSARTPAEKVDCLEELLSIIPKHKGTDKLRADLRRRLSKLKTAPRSKKGAGKRESAFRINKEGASQATIVGSANVGKSSLVVALTNAEPEVAGFPYTTWKPTPGMMPVANIQIQLVDTPPLNTDYIEPELMDLIRRTDLILLMVDLTTDPVDQLQETAAILASYGILPLHRKSEVSESPTATFIPFLVLANKNDDGRTDENVEIFTELLEVEWPILPISTATRRNLEKLKQLIVETLKIIRVYSKAPGKEPDFTAPFVLHEGDTLADFAAKIHQDFAEKLKSARIWGKSVFDGQMVHRDHILEDEDVVELHI